MTTASPTRSCTLHSGNTRTRLWVRPPVALARFTPERRPPNRRPAPKLVRSGDQGSWPTPAPVAEHIEPANRVRSLRAPRRRRSPSRGQADPVHRGPLARSEHTSLALTRAWALMHLVEPLVVADLTRHANASERTLTGRFAADTGRHFNDCSERTSTGPGSFSIAEKSVSKKSLVASDWLPLPTCGCTCAAGWQHSDGLRYAFLPLTRVDVRQHALTRSSRNLPDVERPQPRPERPTHTWRQDRPYPQSRRASNDAIGVRRDRRSGSTLGPQG